MDNIYGLKPDDVVVKNDDIRKGKFLPEKIIVIKKEKNGIVEVVLSGLFDARLSDLFPAQVGLGMLTNEQEENIGKMQEKLEKEVKEHKYRKDLLKDMIKGDCSDECIMNGHDMHSIGEGINAMAGQMDSSILLQCKNCTKRETIG